MKETIIQFGTGNFLRGFFDNFINVLNEQGLYDGKVVIVKPTKSVRPNVINEQKGKFNLFLRGIKDGQEVCEHSEINCVTRCVDPYCEYDEYLSLARNPDIKFVVSNTTEAGIEFDTNCSFQDKPALSFPGKLTQLLFARYKAELDGFVFLPCELIDNNGTELKNCVVKYAELWGLGDDFITWINEKNTFCNTLVDRIVTGYPKDEAEALNKLIGYEDKLLDTAEIYHLWVIEGNIENDLPLQKSGLNIIYTDDVSAYKKMKVRILNGAHTSLVFPSLLCGVQTVGESVNDQQLTEYLNVCLNRYILEVLDKNEENISFAKAVLERFSNPYIKHLWKSISLNSVSKFSVRVLPTILDYESIKDELPKTLVFALGCLIEYYKTQIPDDNEKVVEFIKSNDIEAILANESLWGSDLTRLLPLVNESIDRIHKDGIREAITWAML